MTSRRSSDTHDLKVVIDEAGEVIPCHRAELAVGDTAVSNENPVPVALPYTAKSPLPVSFPASGGGTGEASDSTTHELLTDIRQLLEDSAVPAILADEIAAGADEIKNRFINALGPDGALRNSDAPRLISGSGSAINWVVAFADTTGYQSTSLQLFGTWAGTVTFQASNDGATWYAVSGWPATAAQLPVTTTTAVGLWIFPAIGRYFRAYISAYTSGTVLASAYLRNQPLPLPSVPSINNAQIAGTAVVTAGVNGLQAVGGNIAGGTAPTAYPVPAGGVDTAGKTRRVRTSPDGDLINAGVDANSTARSMRVDARGSVSTVDGDGTLEAILLELRRHTALLSLLPEAMNSGVTIDDADDSIRSTPTN